jgi:hypothetical protein
LTLTNSEKVYGPVLSITAPRAGFVMIHGATTFANIGCTVGCGVQASLHHLQSDAKSLGMQDSIAPRTDLRQRLSRLGVPRGSRRQHL